MNEESGIIKSTDREKKRFKKRYGMQVRGRSMITTILPAIGKRARLARSTDRT